MQCPSCQKTLSDDATQCDSCGVFIEHEPTVVFVPVTPDGSAVLGDDVTSAVPGLRGFGLVIQRGPRTGLAFILQPGVTTIGRDPESDIFLNDITVSRQHCRFIVDQEGLRMEDSGSTNGTYVNGERVDDAVVRSGDEIIIGKYHLVVAVGDA